jgi:hypothetical protein
MSMFRVNHGAALARASIGILGLVVGIGFLPATALASSTTDEVTTAVPGEFGDTEDTTTITLLFAHPLSLSDALEVGAATDEIVTAYAFDNGDVVGEYSPLSGTSPEDYLGYFSNNFGTQPQVNGLVVVREVDAQEKSHASAVQQTSLGEGYPALAADPVVVGSDAATRAERGQELAAARDDMAVARSAGDWRPDDVHTVTLPAPPSPFVWMDIYWFDYGLYSLPNDIGLEFEVNEHNDTVAAPTNMRPLCLDASFKDRFWAKNYGWTWSAYYSTGAIASTGAYADYNDLGDLCRTNSLAIGLRYPKNLDQYSGMTGLQVTIEAPAGLQATSKVSGNVQAVRDTYCDTLIGSGMALTDCMGVHDITALWGGYPSGTYNRATASESRNYYAPLACWTSGSHGTVPPVVVSC